MNLFCQFCGNKVIKTGSYLKGKSELGFTIPIQIYECEACKKEHTICPECSGIGFIENFNGTHDCNECKGMGVIEIKKIKNV